MDPLSFIAVWAGWNWWNDYKKRKKKEEEEALKNARVCAVCGRVIMSYDQYYIDTGTGRTICQNCHDQGNYRGPLLIGRRL